VDINRLQRTADDVLIGGMELPGELILPEHPAGIVVFAHGSGSSRHSARNQFVARVLRSYGLGTLLMDLLTDQEARDRRNVFDIDLLGRRVVEALDWLGTCGGLEETPVGLFGASTGAAAALLAAARKPARVGAVVSRGGRPDLAGRHLAHVRAPTLLIVGSEDHEVLELNQAAMRVLSGPKKLEIVPGATHLFEEPGTLDVAASLAGHWFEHHLSQKGPVHVP
jgi:putative phosphoribosyl transferase